MSRTNVAYCESARPRHASDNLATDISPGTY